MSSLSLQLFKKFLITLNLERQLTFVYVATIYLELNPSVIHWQLKQIRRKSLLYVFPLGFELVYTSPLFEICLGTSGTLISRETIF